MMKYRSIKILFSTACVTVIAASVSVMASSGFDLYTRLHRPPSQNPAPPMLAWKSGVRAPVVPGLDYGGSDRTLVLFLSTDCIHCQHATPFFKSLAGKLAGVSPNASRIVAVYPQTAAKIRQSEGEALPFETKSDVDLGELGVRSTPTMLLV